MKEGGGWEVREGGREEGGRRDGRRSEGREGGREGGLYLLGGGGC